MAAVGIALEVFGLFASGILGIVDLLLPAESPVYISDLAQGHSLLRIGIGLNTSSPESLGGTVPLIQVYNEEQVPIGHADELSSNLVENGTFTTVTVRHDTGYTFQQPTYVEIAGGPDAVCIAYLAQTWADGTQLGWLGDMGKFCGAKWYYSNTYISTRNGSMHKPYCTWIGGPRPGTCSNNSKRHQKNRRDGASGNGTQISPQNCSSHPDDSMYTYSGFKIHTPDFGPVGTQNDFSVPDNPTELCSFPKIEWYKTERFQTSPASSLRPLAIKYFLFNTFALLSNTATNVAGATIKELTTWSGRGERDEQVDFRTSIVGSHDSKHSSKALCASSTSWGPDFVSFEEGLFCDMSLKKTWPLCSEEVGFVKDCYDWSSHTIVGGNRRKRAIKYSRILEWK
ncbi:Nn.00g044850.m01.CDS01 [Neocucurbitaria sp. VM-36]